MDYGLKEFRELMENRYKECDDPMSVPFGVDPHGGYSKDLRCIRKEVYRDVLENFPDSIGISRHSKRLIEELRSENERLKQPMKDHVFREEVNALKQVCLNYANTDQLRSRLADFLQSFKEKCQ